MKKLKKVAAVLRSYGKRQVVSNVNDLLSMGLGMVVVVTNAAEDNGSTAAWLKDVKDERLHIVEMWEAYSWVNGLNRGVMEIQFHNVGLSAEEQIDYIMNISNEAEFSKKHLLEMQDKFVEKETLGVVGVTWFAYKPGAKKTKIELGRSYRHPRNTGMMVSIKAVGAVCGWFNPVCDDMGGMEDIEFVLRMLAMSKFEYEMLDFQIKLLVDVNRNQEEKEKTECEAMDQIFGMWRQKFPLGSLGRNRIEGAIEKMNIDK